MTEKSPFLGSSFENALGYAFRLHRTQRRKGSGGPYISHLLSVSALVLEDGGCEEEAVAALLHDAIEDQGGEAIGKEIDLRFGAVVGSLVRECTEPEHASKKPWQERKQAYLHQMEGISPPGFRIALADKLHNLRSILRNYADCGPGLWKRFHAGRRDQIWFFRSFLNLARRRSKSPMVSQLEHALDLLGSDTTE